MRPSHYVKVSFITCCFGILTIITGCAPNSAGSGGPQSTPITPANTTNNQTATSQTTSDTSSSPPATNSTGSPTTTTSPPKSAPPTPVKPVKPQYPPLVKLGSHGPNASYLNEALSTLGYLPVRFTPVQKLTTNTLQSTLGHHFVPIKGTYQWRDKASASALSSLWKQDVDTVVTQGALMHFQSVHHLAVDGVAGPNVWHALSQALQAHAVTHTPYTFITVDEHQPEMLRVWQNGKVVLQTKANTGIAQSPTAIGTWPIYLRYQTQEMKGTTPWGTTYDDPGVPYVNYFHGGDAVHGFPRASYGTPQSMGCVEIPIPVAKKVYQLVSYGTLVSVRKN